jgi:excisionase family DNA binding protein
MSAAAILDVAADLLLQADKIRDAFPEVAAALEADGHRLLVDVPSVSVAQAADLLGQSRPTIYEWIKAGHLLAVEADSRGIKLAPESLLTIIPVLREWELEGREGRPSHFLREWFDGAIERRERRREFADRRRAGLTDLRPPRRRAPVIAAAR